jgi:hypothetical protein
MKAHSNRLLRSGAAFAVVVCAICFSMQSASAVDIAFRNFSPAAALGPPADAYAVKLANISTIVLGQAGQVRFAKYSPTPAVPKEFKNIMAAVAAGGPLAGGKGFDAAYISGSDLNAAWGFIYNSGVPLGPTFDEFVGFLYGKSIGGTETGLDQLQRVLDKKGSNIVAVPIAGSCQQISGYFKLPIGNAGATPGIGVAGMCQQNWTFRYLPPAQYVLERACDDLVARGVIPKKNIKFIQAIAGGGSLVKAVADGKLQAFEFATPVDDYSQLFNLPEGNPGTVGNRYVHFPGWQQQFLVTYMIINKTVWNKLSPAQQVLVKSVARDNVLSSYGETIRKQGEALEKILTANDGDKNPENNLVLVQWPDKDLALLRDATIEFLNDHASDKSLSEQDLKDFSAILESLRAYVSENSGYWKVRDVPTAMRFQGWKSDGKSWEQKLK